MNAGCEMRTPLRLVNANGVIGGSEAGGDLASFSEVQCLGEHAHLVRSAEDRLRAAHARTHAAVQ